MDTEPKTVTGTPAPIGENRTHVVYACPGCGRAGSTNQAGETQCDYCGAKINVKG